MNDKARTEGSPPKAAKAGRRGSKEQGGPWGLELQEDPASARQLAFLLGGAVFTPLWPRSAGGGGPPGPASGPMPAW